MDGKVCFQKEKRQPKDGLQRVQSAFQISLDVVQMLQPDSDADQILRNACALALLFRQAAV